MCSTRAVFEMGSSCAAGKATKKFFSVRHHAWFDVFVVNTHPRTSSFKSHSMFSHKEPGDTVAHDAGHAATVQQTQPQLPQLYYGPRQALERVIDVAVHKAHLTID